MVLYCSSAVWNHHYFPNRTFWRNFPIENGHRQFLFESFEYIFLVLYTTFNCTVRAVLYLWFIYEIYCTNLYVLPITIKIYIMMQMSDWLLLYFNKAVLEKTFHYCSFLLIIDLWHYIFHFLVSHHLPFVCNPLSFALFFNPFFHLFNHQKCLVIHFPISLWPTL